MSAPSHTPAIQKDGSSRYQLRMTWYERVSAALTSLLGMVGMVTLLMSLIWLSRTIQSQRPPSRVTMAQPPVPGPQVAGQHAGELVAPVMGELSGGEEPPPEWTLATIAPVVESQLAALEALKTTEGDGRDGRSRGDRDGGGPEGGGPLIGTLQPGDRWEIRFSASDLDEYKRQLDSFGIELGVAGGGVSTVDYVKDFTAVRPTTRLAQDPKREKRIRFLYRDGPLKQADRDLAREAGVEVDGRIVFQFHTDEMYRTLLKLEFAQMRPRGIRISQVVRTVFGVRKSAQGYEFYVIRLDHRVPGFSPPRRMSI
jgi:hypothetical protein